MSLLLNRAPRGGGPRAAEATTPASPIPCGRPRVERRRNGGMQGTRGQGRRAGDRRAAGGHVVAAAEASAPFRPDDVLPDNLADCIFQSSEATAAALKKGILRCTVEILLPEFWDPTSGPVFSEDGDQQRFWKLTRRFVDNLMASGGYERVRVLYPDMGVTAMLKNQWPDAPFEIDCLNDLRPYKDEDEVIVMAAVDPLGADDCRRIAAEVLDEKPLILFNPRLSSGEVGVGLNMRRIQNQFLQTFLVTYSIRPLGDIGSVFRRYPGMWQVFVEDKEAPGRYRVAAERPSRPGGEALEYIIKSALNPGAADAEGQGGQPGLLDQISSTVSSIQRFMKSISK